MRLLAISAVGLVVLAAGCGEWPESPPQGPGPTSADHAGPCASNVQSLTLVPSTAAPGELFTVTYPSRKVRGDDVYMSRMSGSKCRLEYLLYNDGLRYTWARITEPEFRVLASLGKRSSVRAVVPRGADFGKYQICDGDTRACAVLTVQD